MNNMKTSPAKTGNRWYNALLPGIITAAVVFGPSKMTITSKMGAGYGTSLLWVVVVAIFFMAVYTGMAARIGRASQMSFLSIVREKWGKTVAMVIGIGIFLVTTSFQAGNAIGAGIAMAELTKTNTTIWVILFTAAAVLLLFLKAFYRILEKVMLSIIILMLLSFVTTCFLSKPSFSEIAAGLRPMIPDGSMPLIIAFTASCFSLVGAIYQSYLVQERARNLNIPNHEIKDKSLTGIVLLGFMSACVMLSASAVLHSRGLQINNAADMGKSLEPLFGGGATMLFLIGLLGASISSLIGNSTVGGTLLSDALGSGNGLERSGVKGYIALVMVIGATIAVIFGKLPLELIVFAQSVTILIVPVIGIAMYLVANNQQIMGKLVNTAFTKIVGGLGLILILYLAAKNIISLF
ncbi:Mn2+ and Fe2+ transporters of the NRAMP family [bacterium A37T11]|nr:Mn2+ and Fe2+ transporters of the NRAMP family [bacterium A37T11]